MSVGVREGRSCLRLARSGMEGAPKARQHLTLTSGGRRDAFVWQTGALQNIIDAIDGMVGGVLQQKPVITTDTIELKRVVFTKACPTRFLDG